MSVYHLNFYKLQHDIVGSTSAWKGLIYGVLAGRPLPLGSLRIIRTITVVTAPQATMFKKKMGYGPRESKQLCYTSLNATDVCVLCFFSHTVYLRSPTSVCMNVPGERVMRTAGASLNNQGSLAEKRAGALTLPEARGKAQQLQCFPVLWSLACICTGTQLHVSKPARWPLNPHFRPTTFRHLRERVRPCGCEGWWFYRLPTSTLWHQDLSSLCLRANRMLCFASLKYLE